MPHPTPDWFRSTGKHSGWRTNVARGLHPLGRELRPSGKGRCDLFPADVHGAFIRVAWKACVEYVPSTNPRVYTKAERDAMKAEAPSPTEPTDRAPSPR